MEFDLIRWRLHLLSQYAAQQSYLQAQTNPAYQGLGGQAYLADRDLGGQASLADQGLMPTQPFQRFEDQARFIKAEGCSEDDEAYHSSARSSPISFRTDSVSPPRMDYHLPYPLLPILPGLPQSQPLDLSLKPTFSEKFNCTLCNKSYNNKANLERHEQIHRKSHPCNKCDKTYSTAAALNLHMRTHSGGCECKFCGKTFSRPWLLQGHLRTHTGEKPFSCTVCNKSFADKSNLRAHTQTHSSLKPFSCANCGKRFALKSYLSKHEESSCFKKNLIKSEP